MDTWGKDGFGWRGCLLSFGVAWTDIIEICKKPSAWPTCPWRMRLKGGWAWRVDRLEAWMGMKEGSKGRVWRVDGSEEWLWRVSLKDGYEGLNDLHGEHEYNESKHIEPALAFDRVLLCLEKCIQRLDHLLCCLRCHKNLLLEPHQAHLGLQFKPSNPLFKPTFETPPFKPTLETYPSNLPLKPTLQTHPSNPPFHPILETPSFKPTLETYP